MSGEYSNSDPAPAYSASSREESFSLGYVSPTERVGITPDTEMVEMMRQSPSGLEGSLDNRQLRLDLR